jgi:hypothetical protein
MCKRIQCVCNWAYTSENRTGVYSSSMITGIEIQISRSFRNMDWYWPCFPMHDDMHYAHNYHPDEFPLNSWILNDNHESLVTWTFGWSLQSHILCLLSRRHDYFQCTIRYTFTVLAEDILSLSDHFQTWPFLPEHPSFSRRTDVKTRQLLQDMDWLYTWYFERLESGQEQGQKSGAVNAESIRVLTSSVSSPCEQKHARRFVAFEDGLLKICTFCCIVLGRRCLIGSTGFFFEQKLLWRCMEKSKTQKWHNLYPRQSEL